MVLGGERFRLVKEYRNAVELEAIVRERLGENVALQVHSDRLVDWVANVFGPPEMVLRHQMAVERISVRLRRRFHLKN